MSEDWALFSAWAGIFLRETLVLTKYECAFFPSNVYPGPWMLRAILTVFVLVITQVFPPVLVCSTLRTLLFTSRWCYDATLQGTAAPPQYSINTVNCCKFIIMVWLLWSWGGEDADDWCYNCLFSHQQQQLTTALRHRYWGTTHCLAGGHEVVIVLHYLDKYFIVN